MQESQGKGRQIWFIRDLQESASDIQSPDVLSHDQVGRGEAECSEVASTRGSWTTCSSQQSETKVKTDALRFSFLLVVCVFPTLLAVFVVSAIDPLKSLFRKNLHLMKYCIVGCALCYGVLHSFIERKWSSVATLLVFMGQLAFLLLTAVFVSSLVDNTTNYILCCLTLLVFFTCVAIRAKVNVRLPNVTCVLLLMSTSGLTAYGVFYSQEKFFFFTTIHTAFAILLFMIFLTLDAEWLVCGPPYAPLRATLFGAAHIHIDLVLIYVHAVLIRLFNPLYHDSRRGH